MKRIAVLTSGGDAPGMNAAVRAVVRYGMGEGLEVFGIRRGFAGLIDDDIELLDMRSVSDIILRGGTILRTARCKEFETESGQIAGVRILKKHKIEGVVVIGGDGSFLGAQALCRRGIPAVGIPGTIDNDLGYTEYSLGFDTACNTVLEAINKLRDTMTSHERACIVEVMGRNCGDIALYSGLCGGAEIILLPEIEVDYGEIARRLKEYETKGKTGSIVVLCEGVCRADDLKSMIMGRVGISMRATVLGHLQRGGAPSARDRFLGTSFGVHAVRLLKNGMGGRVCGVREAGFFDMDIGDGLAVKKVFNKELYDIATAVARSFL